MFGFNIDTKESIMNLINNYQTPVKTSQQTSLTPAPKTVEQSKALDYKPDVLDVLSEKVVNRRDITDTVTVPRAIFKGYLCFTAGTAINAIAGMLKQGKFSKGLGIAGSLISIYGTFNFVKSFLIKDKNLTETGK